MKQRLIALLILLSFDCVASGDTRSELQDQYKCSKQVQIDVSDRDIRNASVLSKLAHIKPSIYNEKYVDLYFDHVTKPSLFSLFGLKNEDTLLAVEEKQISISALRSSIFNIAADGTITLFEIKGRTPRKTELFVKRKNEYVRLAVATDSKQKPTIKAPAFTTPTSRPIDAEIQSEYGMREINGHKEMNEGVEFVPAPGKEVIAPGAGTVASVTSTSVTIQHNAHARTALSNLQSVKVKKGDKLERAQAIGTAGKLPLHYEVYAPETSVNWLPVDPEYFILDKHTRCQSDDDCTSTYDGCSGAIAVNKKNADFKTTCAHTPFGQDLIGKMPVKAKCVKHNCSFIDL